VAIISAAFLLFAIASFAVILNPYKHLDSLAIHQQQQIYHLGSFTNISGWRYMIFRCERLGIICRGVYESPIYVWEPKEVILNLNKFKNQLNLHIDGKEIFTYKP
jgi:hypothetical protein